MPLAVALWVVGVYTNTSTRDTHTTPLPPLLHTRTHLLPPWGVECLRADQHLVGDVPRLHRIQQEAVACFFVCFKGGGGVGVVVVCVCVAGVGCAPPSYHTHAYICIYTYTQKESLLLPSSSTRFSRSRSFFFLPSACVHESRSFKGRCVCM